MSDILSKEELDALIRAIKDDTDETDDTPVELDEPPAEPHPEADATRAETRNKAHQAATVPKSQPIPSEYQKILDRQAQTIEDERLYASGIINGTLRSLVSRLPLQLNDYLHAFFKAISEPIISGSARTEFKPTLSSQICALALVRLNPHHDDFPAAANFFANLNRQIRAQQPLTCPTIDYPRQIKNNDLFIDENPEVDPLEDCFRFNTRSPLGKIKSFIEWLKQDPGEFNNRIARLITLGPHLQWTKGLRQQLLREVINGFEQLTTAQKTDLEISVLGQEPATTTQVPEESSVAAETGPDSSGDVDDPDKADESLELPDIDLAAAFPEVLGGETKGSPGAEKKPEDPDDDFELDFGIDGDPAPVATSIPTAPSNENEPVHQVAAAPPVPPTPPGDPGELNKPTEKARPSDKMLKALQAVKEAQNEAERFRAFSDFMDEFFFYILTTNLPNQNIQTLAQRCLNSIPTLDNRFSEAFLKELNRFLSNIQNEEGETWKQKLFSAKERIEKRIEQYLQNIAASSTISSIESATIGALENSLIRYGLRPKALFRKQGQKATETSEAIKEEQQYMGELADKIIKIVEEKGLLPEDLQVIKSQIVTALKFHPLSSQLREIIEEINPPAPARTELPTEAPPAAKPVSPPAPEPPPGPPEAAPVTSPFWQQIQATDTAKKAKIENLDAIPNQNLKNAIKAAVEAIKTAQFELAASAIVNIWKEFRKVENSFGNTASTVETIILEVEELLHFAKRDYKLTILCLQFYARNDRDELRSIANLFKKNPSTEDLNALKTEIPKFLEKTWANRELDLLSDALHALSAQFPHDYELFKLACNCAPKGLGPQLHQKLVDGAEGYLEEGGGRLRHANHRAEGKKPASQDSTYCDEMHSIICVGDGMGGPAGGREASTITITKLEANPKADISDIAKKAITRMVARSEQDASLIRMGTTLAMIREKNDILESTVIGDSRNYVFKFNGTSWELLHISYDQKWANVNAIKQHKEPIRYAFENPEENNDIYNSIGADNNLQPPETENIPNEPGLICMSVSDGFTDYLSPEDILKAVNEYGYSLTPQVLTNLALINQRKSKNGQSFEVLIGNAPFKVNPFKDGDHLGMAMMVTKGPAKKTEDGPEIVRAKNESKISWLRDAAEWHDLRGKKEGPYNKEKVDKSKLREALRGVLQNIHKKIQNLSAELSGPLQEDHWFIKHVLDGISPVYLDDFKNLLEAYRSGKNIKKAVNALLFKVLPRNPFKSGDLTIFYSLPESEEGLEPIKEKINEYPLDLDNRENVKDFFTFIEEIALHSSPLARKGLETCVSQKINQTRLNQEKLKNIVKCLFGMKRGKNHSDYLQEKQDLLNQFPATPQP